MRQAISSLRNKEHIITDEEAEAVTVAILLHDIGHGPFSHVLENTLVDISHENVSLLLMNELNNQFNGRISLAIKIFKNEYHKKFLHQLVSSQLDVDRLDYLGRDSFFTGVTEGLVGIDRIIKMLNIWNDNLVVEIKGIYSIEKFLIARRLMYWQVYLHKTVVSAEFMLINILKRATELVARGEKVFATPSLAVFLESNFNANDFRNNIKINDLHLLTHFSLLDDNDVLASIKEWQNHQDKVLAYLSKNLTNRNLFKIKISEKPFSKTEVEKLRKKITTHFNASEENIGYYYINEELTNSAYNKNSENIRILTKNEKIMNIQDASDINLLALSKLVRKYFLCFPKELDFK
jgi:hypothetical protein